jgi:D-alanyl-D-alanine carboxypeptidase
MISFILGFILSNLVSQIKPLGVAADLLLPKENSIEVRLPTAEGPTRIVNNSLGILTTAKGHIVIDAQTGKILLEKKANEKLPLASITKLMTVLVFLDTNPDWEKEVVITKDDARIGSWLDVWPGESLKIKDLFYSALIGSNNNAIAALVRSTGLSEEEFVGRMNTKAGELGLANASFSDPTGLEAENVASAGDIAELLDRALKNEKIKEALESDAYEFRTINTKSFHRIKNTDKLLGSYLKVVGGKTGYTVEAGFNLAIEVAGDKGQEIIVVVLGSRSSEDRFQEAKGLAAWAFENYFW